MAKPCDDLSKFTAVIVTGGSSGIGKSFIKLMQTMRPDLRFCNLSRREPDLKSDALKLEHIACDLSDPVSLGQAVPRVLAWLKLAAPTGRLLLINNSGFGAYGHFPEPGIDHQLEMLDVNIRALVELTGRLLPELKARGGAVINVASTAAFQPTAYLAAYGASKAFVLHWSLALNEELRGTGVHVLAVCPGPTSTDFFRRAGLKEGSVPDALGMTSEAVVRESLAALAAGRAQVVTGWKNWLGAVLVTKLPKPWAAWLTAKVLARYRLKKVSA